MKRLLIGFALVGVLWGQGQAVNQVDGPPPFAFVRAFFYNAASPPQVTYICYAPQFAPITVFAISGVPALTSIAVSTNVGTITFGATAQLWAGQQVTVAGSTTALLNGTYKVQTVSGSTVTITTVGVSDGTYNNAAMTVSTNEPLVTALVWSIQVFNYPGANLGTSYFGGNPQGNTVPSGLACSARSTW